MTEASLSHPFMSVLIRSFNRLPYVSKILEVCLNQTYDKYEIVVLEQSADDHWDKHRKIIEKYNGKINVIRSHPLGPSGARNVGVSHCKGEVVLFVDDDDIPVGDNWIAEHAKNYIDPLCIGVSGRHIHQLNEVSRYNDIKGGVDHAYRRCLTISFMVRGRVFTGINTVKKPVEWLHGNNCSLRKLYILKLGGWYPYIQGAGEEHSLFFKFQKVKNPGEYLMFDPQPIVLRRFDMPGGVGRRMISLHTLLVHSMQYYHWVIGAHFPVRFYGLYPIFMLYGFHQQALFFYKISNFEDVFWKRWFGTHYGRKVYILSEFLKFPFLVLQFIFIRKPKWTGQIQSFKE